MVGRVAWISYTPVKGLQLLEVEEVELTEAGIPGDRRFHLIDERGFLTNGKRVGALQQVRAAWNERASRLSLQFPGGSVVESEVERGDAVTTSFYGRQVDGHLVAGPFSDALSDHAGKRLRLVEADRPGAGVDRGRAGAVTLLTAASLDTLAEAAEVESLDARRFRMNFGIDGVDAHAEDEWLGADVRLGEATVRPTGHVGRCLVTSRDAETGEITLDTLDALATYRLQIGTTEELAFGIHAEVRQPGRIRRGDDVALI